MAQRRMVSVKIIDSAKFIKMPVSTQSLYFHLIARADDDGVVEAFNVMRMIGASEDDLKVLVGKQFATVLNDDLVTFINDWNEHNLIRSDRKIDSIYRDLLLQVVSDIELKERKERADRRKPLQLQQPDAIEELEEVKSGTSQGQPEDSIGKVRLGKVSEGKNNKNIYVAEIIEYLNEKTGKSFKLSTGKTASCLNARWNEGFTELQDYKTVIDIKCKEWLKPKKDEKDMSVFLRPETLFGTKFESYLNEAPKKSNENQKKQSNGIAPLEVEITAEYYDPFAR